MKVKNRIARMYIMYAAVFALFILLTVTSTVDITNIAINLVLFVVVAIILLASRRNMKEVQKITEDLNTATQKIEHDFEEKVTFLWESYADQDPGELFHNEILQEEYKDYLQERYRLAAITRNGYKCNLDDYINEELIDKTVKKNVLNLIPGAMTGLGILGTFVGLTIALQHFNTGSAQEIENSIAPLMGGIKVAFHTSIFGMIFSLLFNYLYKELIEDAYLAVDRFMYAFNCYVDSDAETDNANAVQSMLREMPLAVGRSVLECMTPILEKMNNSLESFTNKVASSQLEGMAEIVDHFIESMNSSLGDSFVRLGETIDQTCTMQQKNNELMTGVLDRVSEMTSDIAAINDLSIKTVENMSGYVERMEGLQNIINENFMSVNIQLEHQKEYDEKLKEYMEILVNYERQIGEASNKFTEDMEKQLEMLGQMENKISESTRENLEMLATKADDYNKTLTEVASQQIQLVLSMANDYSEQVTNRMNQLSDIGQNMSDTAAANMKQLYNTAEQYNKNLADTAKQQVAGVLAFTDRKTDDMSNAAKELADVSKTLNNRLSDSLTTAFGIIDKNLADITRHLSGTIAEIEDTTDRVPAVVKNSYDGMKTTFDQMQVQYSQLVSAFEKMSKELQQNNYRR